MNEMIKWLLLLLIWMVPALSFVAATASILRAASRRRSQQLTRSFHTRSQVLRGKSDKSMMSAHLSISPGEGLPGWVILVAVLLLLIGLPLAVWLDLRALAEHSLDLQANNLNSVVTSVRSYYARNVVARVLASPGSTQVVHNYLSVPGAIPIPATLSLELGKVIGEEQGGISYRFVSDYPFKDRAPHELDAFEEKALAALRKNPEQKITDMSWSSLDGQIRLIAPVIMSAPCVSCHNSHPGSPSPGDIDR
jgi:hypothetical protein